MCVAERPVTPCVPLWQLAQAVVSLKVAWSTLAPAHVDADLWQLSQLPVTLACTGVEGLPPAPSCVPLWHAAVDIGEREPLGRSPLGERWIVPILGGPFWGAPGHEALCGVVRPGGADRQLQLAEGHRRLHALYELQVDDGTVLTVLNQVTIDETRSGERYAIGHLEVTAPAGPHEWLNHRKIVGTLQVLRPERSAVLIRTFVVEG
jgi:hypothetical protein